MTNLFASVRAGLGIGPMPCLLADTEPDLMQVFPPDPDSVAYTWIVTRPELKDAPRVRAFIDFFTKRIAMVVKDYEDRAAQARASQP
jgi:DNA-binding transcriptional LysR family regulator